MDGSVPAGGSQCRCAFGKSNANSSRAAASTRQFLIQVWIDIGKMWYLHSNKAVDSNDCYQAGEDTMKKTLFALALATSAFVAAPASAAEFVITIDPLGGSADFGNTGFTSGTIADQFSLTVPSGMVNGLIGSIALTPALNVTFTSVFFDSKPFDKILSDGVELFTLSNTPISAGTHTIFVNGTWGTQGGSYAGTINYLAAAGAVPEPATWAMLILGFGMAGASLRYRRRRTAVRYA